MAHECHALDSLRAQLLRGMLGVAPGVACIGFPQDRVNAIFLQYLCHVVGFWNSFLGATPRNHHRQPGAVVQMRRVTQAHQREVMDGLAREFLGSTAIPRSQNHDCLRAP